MRLIYLWSHHFNGNVKVLHSLVVLSPSCGAAFLASSLTTKKHYGRLLIESMLASFGDEVRWCPKKSDAWIVTARSPSCAFVVYHFCAAIWCSSFLHSCTGSFSWELSSFSLMHAVYIYLYTSHLKGHWGDLHRSITFGKLIVTNFTTLCAVGKWKSKFNSWMLLQNL